WRLAPSCSVINVLGGSEIDLNEAELAASQVELKIVTVLGGAEIRVPDGVNVEGSELAILGGNDVDVGEHRSTPGAAVVHLRLVTILGGVEVRRGPKLTRRQRKELRERARDLDRGSRPGDQRGAGACAIARRARWRGVGSRCS